MSPLGQTQPTPTTYHVPTNHPVNHRIDPDSGTNPRRPEPPAIDGLWCVAGDRAAWASAAAPAIIALSEMSVLIGLAIGELKLHLWSSTTSFCSDTQNGYDFEHQQEEKVRR